MKKMINLNNSKQKTFVKYLNSFFQVSLFFILISSSQFIFASEPAHEEKKAEGHKKEKAEGGHGGGEHSAEPALEAEYEDGSHNDEKHTSKDSSHHGEVNSHNDINLNEFVMMPEKCFSKKTQPCFVKTKNKSTKLKIEKVELYILKDSVVKIESFHPVNISPVSGKFVIEKKDHELKVKTYEVKGNYSYVTKLDEGIELVDGGDLYLYKIKEHEVEKEFLDREEFVVALAPFFKDKNSLKKKLQEVSSRYQKNFNKEIAGRESFLKRKVASVDEEESDFIKKEKAKKEQEKKIKQQFYKKSFEH